MATIGQIAVNLTARTAEFKSGVQTANKSLGGFRDKLDKTKDKLLSMRGALGAAAGVFGGAKLLGMIQDQLDYADSLAKTADKIGATTQELAALRFAGEQTGVSITSMDASLQRMVRRLAEATSGSGAAFGALNQLGLSADKLNQMTLFERFKEIAEALTLVSDQSEKVSIAFSLFGREGVGLVNTLAVGAKGLQDYSDEAKNLGLLMDRNTAAAAEKANDAMHRFTEAVRGLQLQFATGLAPVLEQILDLMLQLKDAAGFVGDRLLDIVPSVGGGFAESVARSVKPRNREGAAQSGGRIFSRAQESEQKKQTKLLEKIEGKPTQRVTIVDF